MMMELRKVKVIHQCIKCNKRIEYQGIELMMSIHEKMEMKKQGYVSIICDKHLI